MPFVVDDSLIVSSSWVNDLDSFTTHEFCSCFFFSKEINKRKKKRRFLRVSACLFIVFY